MDARCMADGFMAKVDPVFYTSQALKYTATCRVMTKNRDT